MTTTITLVTVTLAIEQPWAVGGVSGDGSVDLPVLIDPRAAAHAKPHLPSTSLVGSLRAHLHAELGAAMTEEWLGMPIGSHEEPTGGLRHTPSRLWALGAAVDGGASIRSRGRTQIDAARGAAKAGTLRVEQSVVASTGATSVTWQLEHEGPRGPTLLDAIATWRPYVGRGRSTGQGRARVVDVGWLTVDLTRADHLTWWLTGRPDWYDGGPPPPDADVGGQPGKTSGAEAQSWRWRVVEPVHIGDEGGGPSTSTIDRPNGGRSSQVQSTFRRGGRPAVPGTTWKGIFRNRVAYILDACGGAGTDVVVDALFGRSPQASAGRTVVPGVRAKLRFCDSAFEAPPGASHGVGTRTHVAIDRITGGAHDGLLFQVESVLRGSLTTLAVESDAGLSAAVTNLLGHVVNDIHDGLVGVGGMTTRGYGWLELTDPPVEALGPLDVDSLVHEAHAWRLSSSQTGEAHA